MTVLQQTKRAAELPIKADGIHRSHSPRRNLCGRRGHLRQTRRHELQKEIGVASVYGRSDAMDAFLAAALIPSLLVNLISESMNQALVPTLVRVREQEGRERAQQLLSEFNALDVPAPNGGSLRSDRSSRAGLLSAHRLQLPARQARAFHPPLLRPLAHRSAHRHRH